MASLNVVNGLGAVEPGAIVGDAPNPYSASQLTPNAPNSEYLTSGALSAGDGPELGGLPDATIEFWFQLSALPAAERILMQGPEVSAGNRQWGFTVSTAGKVKFYVRGAGLYTTTGNVALQLNTWYYVVGVADSAAALVRLYINAVQDTTAAYTSPIGASSLATLNAGSFMVGDMNADVTFYFDEIAVYRRLLATTRISAHYTAGTAMGLATQKPGARMIDVLDKTNTSRTAPRSLQAGSRSVVESYFSGQAPLDELQKADAADNVDAMLFVARDGTITFLDAGHRSNAPYNASQVTFGDAGGAEIAYQDAPMDYSEQFLVNEWNVTRRQGRKSGTDIGETQTVSDTTSINSYMKHSQSLGDLPLRLDADASAIATALLAKFKDPMLRVTALTGTCGDTGFAEAFFRREIGDRVTVKRTPPGGGARISNDFYIQSISIDGTPDKPWTASFGLSPL